MAVPSSSKCPWGIQDCPKSENKFGCLDRTYPRFTEFIDVVSVAFSAVDYPFLHLTKFS